MSFFNSLLSAINQGSGAYNDEQDFQQMMMKDKVGLDSTRANTNLANQRFDFNELNMSQLLELAKINNANATTQGEGFTLENIKKQQGLDALEAYLNNSLTSPNAANNMNALLATGTGYSPTNQANLDNNNTMIAIANAMAQRDSGMPRVSVGHQGQQYSGNSLETLQNAIKALTATSSSSKPQILGNYNEAGMRTGNSWLDPVSGQAIPITTQGQSMDGSAIDINQSIQQAMNEQMGTSEFDTTAERADFMRVANEVYQRFLSAGLPPEQAEERTTITMLKQLGLDDDWEIPLLSDKELTFSNQLAMPNSKEAFDALPVGTPYVLPNGQSGVK